jgi:hypothetical protein
MTLLDFLLELQVDRDTIERDFSQADLHGRVLIELIENNYVNVKEIFWASHLHENIPSAIVIRLDK